MEMQASDRAHRISQIRPVFIDLLIARVTVDEKILQLQEKKRALVRNIITTKAGSFKSLAQDDVKVLFEQGKRSYLTRCVLYRIIYKNCILSDIK